MSGRVDAPRSRIMRGKTVSCGALGNVMQRQIIRILLVTICLIGSLSAAQAQQTVTIDGVNAVLLKPHGALVGSLILLAGGDGHLGIRPNGRITRLRGNQLVRTRSAYAARGFAVLVPEAEIDLAAAVKYMAAIKRPVTLVGTSRGTQRAARGIGAGARPDALVLTSGFLSAQSGPGVHHHAIFLIGSPQRLPRTLVIHHRHDGCPFTRPAGVAPFIAWSRGRAHVLWLDGGKNIGDPCQARAHHGFNGIDGQVVAAVANFARAR